MGRVLGGLNENKITITMTKNKGDSCGPNVFFWEVN